MQPETLIEAVKFFADLDTCHTYMKRIKWPDGKVVCPHCDGKRIGEIATRKMLRCKDCRKQFSYKVGTIFEDSPLGLDKWFVALWSVANCKNGISSHELGRALGVTQKTAWFMEHRIREAMRTGTFAKLKGEVESDETFIGGKADNMHKDVRERKILGRGAVGKAIVHGLLERKGEVRCTVVRTNEADELQGRVKTHVEPGATVYTDAHSSYEGLITRFIHQTIDHAKCYARGRIHVNGMENFWSLLKRTLRGTYIAVAPFHLTRYLDEQAFRFNKRLNSDLGRFEAVLSQVVGRRLTYRRLAAIGDSGFMGIK